MPLGMRAGLVWAHLPSLPEFVSALTIAAEGDTHRAPPPPHEHSPTRVAATARPGTPQPAILHME